MTCVLLVQADIHAVYAPGRLFYIRRLDRYLGRARYGSGEHRCVLCESHDAVPDPEPEQLDTDAVHRPAASQPDTAGAAAAPYPGAQFELVEAAPKQRFKRIVLRETCLMDHCEPSLASPTLCTASSSDACACHSLCTFLCQFFSIVSLTPPGVLISMGWGACCRCCRLGTRARGQLDSTAPHAAPALSTQSTTLTPCSSSHALPPHSVRRIYSGLAVCIGQGWPCQAVMSQALAGAWFRVRSKPYQEQEG